MRRPIIFFKLFHFFDFAICHLSFESHEKCWIGKKRSTKKNQRLLTLSFRDSLLNLALRLLFCAYSSSSFFSGSSLDFGLLVRFVVQALYTQRDLLPLFGYYNWVSVGQQ